MSEKDVSAVSEATLEQSGGDFEQSSEKESSSFPRIIRTVAAVPVPALIIAALMLGAGTWVAFSPPAFIEDWFEGEPEFKLVGFDANRARAHAEALTAIGPRQSGTTGEWDGAQYIFNQFQNASLDEVTMETFTVPMFEIGADQDISLCNPGWNQAFPCSIFDAGAQYTTFEHMVDYVIQGYSGSRFISYNDQVGVVNLSNGTDDVLWGEAAHQVGMLWGSIGTTSNTQNFQKAAENDLLALIIVNDNWHCDKLAANDCLPFFKGVAVRELDVIPESIPLIMVSKSMGLEITGQLEGGARLTMNINVENQGDRDIKVPCGQIHGKSEEVIIFGGHHDTTYNTVGAVDNTAGTVTVIEIATQFGELYSKLGTPDKTVRFCTWGGEEEGLWGSSEYVKKHSGELLDSLRVYINFDMNHVDWDTENRGNDVYFFGNDNIPHIDSIISKYRAANKSMAQKYEFHLTKKSNDRSRADAMPYNSDYAPFLYELGEEADNKALGIWGTGCWEYQTYLDDMSRFNEESLALSGVVYGTYGRWLAWGEK